MMALDHRRRRIATGACLALIAVAACLTLRPSRRSVVESGREVGVDPASDLAASDPNSGPRVRFTFVEPVEAPPLDEVPGRIQLADLSTAADVETVVDLTALPEPQAGGVLLAAFHDPAAETAVSGDTPSPVTFLGHIEPLESSR